ncbi:hypothetical protein G6F40_016354 [Rhizopus arrhizus]|nr:hypothetical protein G6F40_016354 [Rhizopus arrhizus]
MPAQPPSGSWPTFWALTGRGRIAVESGPGRAQVAAEGVVPGCRISAVTRALGSCRKGARRRPAGALIFPAQPRGESRSARPMEAYISRRMRSATALTTSAPSCEGSTCTRNGRCPCGRPTTCTICRATSSGSASAGSTPARPCSAWSATPA